MKFEFKRALGYLAILLAGLYVSCDRAPETEDARGRTKSSGGVVKEGEKSEIENPSETPGDADAVAAGTAESAANPDAPPAENTPVVPQGSKVKISWAANTETYLLGYKVLIKEKGSEAAGSLIADIGVNDASFNPLVPSTTLTIASIPALVAMAGKEGCFTVTASISGKESPESTVSCLVFNK
jgi:hypothetical protein